MNDTRVVIQTGNWKIKIVLGLAGLVTIVILAFLYRLEIGLVILACGSVGAIRLILWAKNQYTLEKLQQRQLSAQTRQIELDASLSHWRVQQEKAQAQKMAYDALFIERKAGTFVIGNLPFAFYPSAAASRELAASQPLALPAPALDFFQVMSDPLQAYAIVGTQRIGKSILAQHLAQYLTTKGLGCMVIATKAQPGEWLNCKRFVGNEAVPLALSSLMAEIKQRIEASANTPKLAVFLDDWLNTVALDSDLAEQFFLEAATRILTAGIVPYFLLQSDSKADWGTKHGAQLKNNFVHLLLNAPRLGGQLDHSRLKGVIIYPGEKVQHNVTLPAGLPMLGESEPALELAAPSDPEPTEQEQQILDLHQAGKSSAAICEAVWGYKSSKRYPEIEAVLTRFGRVHRAQA